MRSILKIGFTTRIPTTYATIPFGLGAKGCPFLFKNSGLITAFDAVNYKTRDVYDLSTTIIQTDDTKNAHYYNATHNLGLPCGDYFYKIGVDGYSVGENRLDNVDNTYTIGHVASSKAYGEWIIDFDYTLDAAPRFYIVSDSLNTPIDGEWIGFTMSSNLCFLVDSGGDTIMVDTADYFPTTGRYTLRFVRNSTLDEYVSGPVGTTAMYVNGDIIESEGVSSIIDSSIISSSYIKYSGYFSTPDMGLYSFDGNYPVDFITDTGSFVITSQNGYTEGGSIFYSQIFHTENYMRNPDPDVGDFNNDFNNDFDNLGATGIIDENGEPIQ